jgi:hypothetical protein
VIPEVARTQFTLRRRTASTRRPSRTFFTSAPPTLRSFPSSHPSPLISPRTLSGTVHLFNTLAFLLRRDIRGVVAILTASLYCIADSLLLLLACAWGNQSPSTSYATAAQEACVVRRVPPDCNFSAFIAPASYSEINSTPPLRPSPTSAVQAETSHPTLPCILAAAASHA